MSNQIEKSIEIKAPVSRVWSALTDYKQFGEWFGVNLDQPFEAGQKSTGVMFGCGHGELPWNATVEAIQPEDYFAYSWVPGAIDPNVDYSQDPTTLVEFRLASAGEGTVVTVKETGFEKIPAARRAEILSGNEAGWAHQLENLTNFFSATTA